MEAERKLTILVRHGIGLPTNSYTRNAYSVVFGVGDDRFCTEMVEDPTGNPRWNSEAKITVKTLRRTTLRFVVHNATKTLGQVSVSLKRLSHERREIVAPLKAHRKATTPPTGQLLYEAWLWNDASVTSSESAGAPSPLGKVKDALSHGVHLFIGNGTAAKTRSCDDLTHAADDTGRVFTYDNDGATTTPDDDDDIDDVFARRRNASSLGDLTACGGPPQITGVSPREGATAGGTALTIRGANLGTCKSDVTELAVCGVDCLNTLRYVSPTKLRCTTWRSGDACTGPITIATTSSGRGESLVNFSYVTLAALHCGGGANARGGGGGGGGGWYVSCDDIPSFVIDECPDADVDRTSVAASSADSSFEEKGNDVRNGLLVRNAALRRENDSLHTYIDSLLARVMLQCPHLLQIGGPPSSQPADSALDQFGPPSPQPAVSAPKQSGPAAKPTTFNHRNETVTVTITKTVTETRVRRYEAP